MYRRRTRGGEGVGVIKVGGGGEGREKSEWTKVVIREGEEGKVTSNGERLRERDSSAWAEEETE
jgi:hypothetical protein